MSGRFLCHVEVLFQKIAIFIYLKEKYVTAY